MGTLIVIITVFWKITFSFVLWKICAWWTRTPCSCFRFIFVRREKQWNHFQTFRAKTNFLSFSYTKLEHFFFRVYAKLNWCWCFVMSFLRGTFTLLYKLLVLSPSCKNNRLLFLLIFNFLFIVILVNIFHTE